MKPNTFKGRAFAGLVYLFLYAPIFILIIFSFNASKSRTVWAGFTFDWYIKLFSDDQILNPFYVTILVAALSSVAATIVGTVAAVGINSLAKKPKALALTVNSLPVVNPDIITGVSMMLLFVSVSVFTGIKLGFMTLLLAHITFNIPYVILSVMPKLRQLDKNLYEAALDLGAPPKTAFLKVILPEIMPGVVNGLLIAFTMSIDDFVISYFTSGSSVQTLAMSIYSMTRKRITPEINALSALLFVCVLTPLVIVNLRQARDIKKGKKIGASSFGQ